MSGAAVDNSMVTALTVMHDVHNAQQRSLIALSHCWAVGYVVVRLGKLTVKTTHQVEQTY